MGADCCATHARRPKSQAASTPRKLEHAAHVVMVARVARVAGGEGRAAWAAAWAAAGRVAGLAVAVATAGREAAQSSTCSRRTATEYRWMGCVAWEWARGGCLAGCSKARQARSAGCCAASLLGQCRKHGIVLTRGCRRARRQWPSVCSCCGAGMPRRPWHRWC